MSHSDKTPTDPENNKPNLDENVINNEVEQISDDDKSVTNNQAEQISDVDENVENDNERSTSNFEIREIMNFARDAIGLIVAFGAIFGVLGFIIVNAYLSLVTDIHGFTIVPGRYVSTALWGLIAVIVALSPVGLGWIIGGIRPFKNHKWNLGINFAIAIILTIVVKQLSNDTNSLIDNGATFESVNMQIRLLVAYILSLLGIVSVYRGIILPIIVEKFFDGAFIIKSGASVWFIIFFLITTFIVFITIYPNTPQYFGGGKPTEAQLILEENNITKQLSLTFISGTMTEKIAILSELTDGVLIQDAKGNTMVIKSEHIGAILDIQPTATPMQAVSSTATITPTVTPTP